MGKGKGLTFARAISFTAGLKGIPSTFKRALNRNSKLGVCEYELHLHQLVYRQYKRTNF
jgi:hypothetical protein